MFRKLIVTGIVATVIGVISAPANAAGHVRHYTPSRTATLHLSHSSNHVAKHHATKLTKHKKDKKSKHKGGKKK